MADSLNPTPKVPIEAKTRLFTIKQTPRKQDQETFTVLVEGGMKFYSNIPPSLSHDMVQVLFRHNLRGKS